MSKLIDITGRWSELVSQDSEILRVYVLMWGLHWDIVDSKRDWVKRRDYFEEKNVFQGQILLFDTPCPEGIVQDDRCKSQREGTVWLEGIVRDPYSSYSEEDIFVFGYYLPDFTFIFVKAAPIKTSAPFVYEIGYIHSADVWEGNFYLEGYPVSPVAIHEGFSKFDFKESLDQNTAALQARIQAFKSNMDVQTKMLCQKVAEDFTFLDDNLERIIPDSIMTFMGELGAPLDKIIPING